MGAPIDIYARVSRKGDKEQRSTSGQTGICRAVLAERGLPEGQTFVDDGRSAWQEGVYRPDWEALMTRLESGASGGVIVFDLERFARRMDDGQRLIKASKRGILVLDSDGEFDLNTASGEKAFNDAMSAAIYYSRRLSDRTRRGKRLKAMAGEVDHKRSFGFESDGVTHHPEECAILRDHAPRLLAGETQDSLINELNAAGITTPRGAEWGYTTYRQIMVRPKNAGLIEHNGQVVARLPGPSILDEPTHARLVAMYAARRPGRPPSGRYVLSGLALCDQPGCGSKLNGRPVSGTPRRQYWCKTCRHTFVDAQNLDHWAGAFAVRTLADPAHADAVERATQAANEAQARLAAEAADIENTLVLVAGRLGRQEISLARHDAICGPLEARLAAITAEAEALSAEPAPGGGGNLPARDRDYLGWLEQWTEAEESGDTATRRAMVVRALGGRTLRVGPGVSARFDPDRVTVS